MGITALTWAPEIADPQRFSSSDKVLSYCGLTAALQSSAGKQQRGLIFKERNDYLLTGSNSQRSTGRSSPLRGLCRGGPTPDAPYRMFRGRPVFPNSIFVNGARALFTQMDVWPRCGVDPAQRSKTVRDATSATTTLRETLPLSTGGASSCLDFYLSWMSPVLFPNDCICIVS